MVIHSRAAWTLAQTSSESAPSSEPVGLPPSVSAAALLAIVGILLVGFFLVALAMLGGSWTRRLANQPRRNSQPADRTPLGPRADETETGPKASPQEASTQETKADDPHGRDTRAAP